VPKAKRFGTAHSHSWNLQRPWGELQGRAAPLRAGTQVGADTAALHRSKVIGDRVIGGSLRGLGSHWVYSGTFLL